MHQRRAFVTEARKKRIPFTALCALYEISTKTGYKWRDRANEEGDGALEDRSRRPHSNPLAVSDDVVARLIDVRTAHPYWGPLKLLAWLEANEPWWLLPVASTVGEILKRHGLVRPKQRRRGTTPRSTPLAEATAPNRVWTMDFKGDFRIDASTRCYPLTVNDAYSRMSLCCRALMSTELSPTKKWLERTFSEWGLPDVIRSDNGTPFGTKRLGPISSLSVWLVKLGVRAEYTNPASPEENPRHERFHRTLKTETCLPPAATMSAQQRRFDRFRAEYNNARPHQALHQMTPASVHRASRRPLPDRVPEPEYPPHYELRKVSSRGQIHWNGKNHFLTEPLGSETVGIVEVADGTHEIYFASLLVGRFHQRLPELGVKRTAELLPMSSV